MQYLKLDPFIVESRWLVQLIAKHFDIPQYKGYTLRGSGYSYSMEPPDNKKIRPFILNSSASSFTGNCGLQQYYIGLSDSLPERDAFLKEYYEELPKHLTVPYLCSIIYLIDKEGKKTQWLYPTYEHIANNSVLLSSMRNPRYENHIIELRLLYHPKVQKDLFTIDKQLEPLAIYPEMFQV